MQGLARNSGWNAARTEPFDFSLRYSNCPVCRYSGAIKGSFIQQGGSAFATRAGAGAGPRPGRAHISCQGARQRPKTGRACAGLRGSGQPAQTAAPAAGAGLAPAHIHACSRLVHAHCPHVCSARASADDPHGAVRTAPFEARTGPGYLLQGEIKNQTRVNH